MNPSLLSDFPLAFDLSAVNSSVSVIFPSNSSDCFAKSFCLMF